MMSPTSNSNNNVDSSWAVFSEVDFNPQPLQGSTSAAAAAAATTTTTKHNGGGDPWSDDAWADLSDFYPAKQQSQSSHEDVFDMTAPLDVFAKDDDAMMEDDDMLAEHDADSDSSIPQVHVAIHEQLSSLYDGTEDPETQVMGSIHVQRPKEEGVVVKDCSSFCFVVKDSAGQLVQFQPNADVCHEITDSMPPQSKLNVGDHVLRVTYPAVADDSIKPDHRLTVATYTCSDDVHPIPLLVKSKVQVTTEYCRVGIRLRANPTNTLALTQCTIVLAVPPDVNGESVKSSRDGSVWDAMKRLVAWPLDDIEPGQLLEVQAQFALEESASTTSTASPPPEQELLLREAPKFPILVRCDAIDEQFSDLQLCTDVNDNQFRPIKLRVSRSVRILHRKV